MNELLFPIYLTFGGERIFFLDVNNTTRVTLIK